MWTHQNVNSYIAKAPSLPFRDNSTFISCDCLWITEDKRQTILRVDIHIYSYKYSFTMCMEKHRHMYVCVWHLRVYICICMYIFLRCINTSMHIGTHLHIHTSGHRKVCYICISIIVFVIITLNKFFSLLICDFTPFCLKHFEIET